MSDGLGNVYVFNATPNDMNVFLNPTHAINAGALLSGVTAANSYKPTPVQVARNTADKSNNATFGSVNQVNVSFPVGGGQSYEVDIDPNAVTIGVDLQLYIFFNEVVLVLPTGAGQDAKQLTIAGTPTSDALSEELDAVASDAGGGEL